MDSAINDLKKWREIRNRNLALELEGMRPPAELGVPETDDEFPTESCISRTDCYEEDKKADFRRADDKAVSFPLSTQGSRISVSLILLSVPQIESLGLLMRSPRSQSDGGDKEAQRRQEDAEAKEDGVREMLERQAQVRPVQLHYFIFFMTLLWLKKITFSQIEHQVHQRVFPANKDNASLNLHLPDRSGSKILMKRL